MNKKKIAISTLRKRSNYIKSRRRLEKSGRDLWDRLIQNYTINNTIAPELLDELNNWSKNNKIE